MIAAAFPPAGGSGVQRSAKFARYLPRFGWQPLVWAADTPDDAPSDPTLLADLPEQVVIHRWNRGQPGRHVRRGLNLLRSGGAVGSKVADGLAWRIKRWGTRHPWPDDLVEWARSSADAARCLIEEEGIDAIYSTYSPASNHLLGLTLHEATGRPWIADFRDLWTDDFSYVQPSSKRRRADLSFQRRILETADVVIGVSPSQTRILAGHVPQRRDRFRVITNGFDPADFSFGEPRRPALRSTFVLAHVGRMHRWGTPDAWYAGLTRFVAGLGRQRGSFRLRVVGHADRTTVGRLHDTSVPLSVHGYVPHGQAIREMLDADALLMMAPEGHNAETTIRAKLFEYLAAQRPILLIGPRGGECERIVRHCDAGVCVAADEREIVSGLERLYDAWQADRPLAGCSPQRAERYSRERLTRQLASVLDRLVGDRSPSPTTPRDASDGGTVRAEPQDLHAGAGVP